MVASRAARQTHTPIPVLSPLGRTAHPHTPIPPAPGKGVITADNFRAKLRTIESAYMHTHDMCMYMCMHTHMHAYTLSSRAKETSVCPAMLGAS